MERNVMGELNVYRGSGAKPNFSEIARRHGMDRHTVAKYWREGESAADGRSARGSAFDPLEEVIRAKAQLPGMTKMAVYAFLREGRGEGLPGYGAFTAWCRARDVPFGGAVFFTTTKFRISRLISFGFHRFAKVPHPFFANCPIFPSSRLPRTFCSARRTQPADHDA